MVYERVSIPGFGIAEVIPVSPLNEAQKKRFLQKYNAFINKHNRELKTLSPKGEDTDGRVSGRFNRVLRGFIYGARRGWVTDRELHKEHIKVFTGDEGISQEEAVSYHPIYAAWARHVTRYVEKFINQTMPRDKQMDWITLPEAPFNGTIPGVVFAFPQSKAA